MGECVDTFLKYANASSTKKELAECTRLLARVFIDRAYKNVNFAD